MFAHVFGPSELEIVERAYKLACDRLAQNPLCDVVSNDVRKKVLRERLFFLARKGDDAESLCEKVLTLVPEFWIAKPVNAQ